MLDWLFHRWTKWHEVKVPGLAWNGEGCEPIKVVRQKQQRECLVCGLVERRDLD